MSKVPPGSAWIVLPFVSTIARKWPRPGDAWGVGALSRPNSSPAWQAGVEYEEIPPDTIIIAGDTHIDEHTGRRDLEYVEVLLPRRCFINRVHFNGDSDHLRRVG